MKFEDMKEFPHEDKLRALHGDKNWRVYFPNGDGINTFEVAKFEHNINTNKPIQGLLKPISPGLFFDIEEYVSKDRVNEILLETESL